MINTVGLFPFQYRETPEACQYFAAKVEEMRRHTNIFDVEAILIKPVQRILKYPLLLHELLKVRAMLALKRLVSLVA